MNNKVRLYYLYNKDYSSIKAIIESYNNSELLSENIAIYNHAADQISNSYLVLSNDTFIDTIILEYGGIESHKEDVYKRRIRDGDHSGDLIFGNESLHEILTD